MYLISAYFDDSTNKKLKNYIDKVALKTGNSFMTDNNVPPHMTISSIEAKNEGILLPSFEKLKKSLDFGNIQLVSVGVFFPYVMYAAAVPGDCLLNLSEKIYDEYKDIQETSVSRYYRPGAWLPHVTIGKTLNRTQMNEAFSIMQDLFVPMEATVTGLGLARTNPHEDIDYFDLNG